MIVLVIASVDSLASANCPSEGIITGAKSTLPRVGH